jgi:hypothetical protein
MAPIRALASIAMIPSGTSGMYRITRSPWSTPSRRSALANRFTSRYSRL